jgi:hypothetical protein
MNILSSLLLIILILGSASLQTYHLIKNKEWNILKVQIGIIIIAILLGFQKIYDFPIPTMAEVLYSFIPWKM